MNLARKTGILVLASAFFSSCNFEKSGATGWNYNDSKNGGFEKASSRSRRMDPDWC